MYVLKDQYIFNNLNQAILPILYTFTYTYVRFFYFVMSYVCFTVFTIICFL